MTSPAHRYYCTPLSVRQANALISEWHRHHKPVAGMRFAIAAHVDGKVVGAAVVGRPNARNTDQWTVAEVTRNVTDGTPHACSFLYGACARIAKAQGFERIQTLILEEEPGTSLRAAGWKFLYMSAGGDWNRPSRGGRRMDQPQGPKQVWGLTLNVARGDAVQVCSAEGANKQAEPTPAALARPLFDLDELALTVPR